MVDPRPPNSGFVGVACPAGVLLENKELLVPALVDGVKLVPVFAPPKRLAPVVELPPAAGVLPPAVGVLEPPPNRLDEDVAGLLIPPKRPPPLAGGVPVDAAPPNSGGVDEDVLVVAPAPNNDEVAGFEALLPPKRPPPAAAGCAAAPALSFCALPKEKPLEGVED